MKELKVVLNSSQENKKKLWQPATVSDLIGLQGKTSDTYYVLWLKTVQDNPQVERLLNHFSFLEFSFSFVSGRNNHPSNSTLFFSSFPCATYSRQLQQEKEKKKNINIKK